MYLFIYNQHYNTGNLIYRSSKAMDKVTKD